MRLKTLSVILFVIAAISPLSLQAQGEWRIVHDGCMPDVADAASASKKVKSSKRFLPAIKKNWDPQKVYPQMVILVEFADKAFLREDAKGDYDKMLNESGYNEGNGPSCMADYYREQSEGVFNLRFDVYGPVKVSKNALHVDNPDDKTRNYGKEVFIEATQKVLAANPEQNYRQYDWNGDGYIEQVIYVYAGLAGNAGAATYGYIWPNTSSFTTINTPDGVIISNYSSSGELWPTSTPRSCGIGTICHEFTHCLGLPDIYPVGTDTSLPYSMVDEWDLMDGGNFTSYGWCPPNYSPLEKWLLGWKEPVELKEPASIVDMKPVAEGGNSYIIKHTDSEYLLLENRQQRGWDAGLPGKGLVVYHVNYSSGSWSANKVNSTVGKPYYQLVHADNMDYDQWVTYKTNNGWSKYKNPGYMNCRYLSSSPYPWSTDTTETVNNSLTDTSVPASLMQNKNAGGSKNLSKPITNIRMSDDGLISFDFMGGDSTLSAIRGLQMNVGSASEGIYDLRGRRLDSTPAKGVFIRRYADGTIRKCFK